MINAAETDPQEHTLKSNQIFEQKDGLLAISRLYHLDISWFYPTAISIIKPDAKPALIFFLYFNGCSFVNHKKNETFFWWGTFYIYRGLKNNCFGILASEKIISWLRRCEDEPKSQDQKAGSRPEKPLTINRLICSEEEEKK